MAVGHLDSGFTVLLKEIRAAVEVCEHAAHGSFRPKQIRAGAPWASRATLAGVGTGAGGMRRALAACRTLLCTFVTG